MTYNKLNVNNRAFFILFFIVDWLGKAMNSTHPEDA